MQTKEIFSDKMGMTFLKIPMMEKDAEECGDGWTHGPCVPTRQISKTRGGRLGSLPSII